MKQYDVIIIGGGLGGLSSGVMLSKEGLNVCVLEQHSIIGGCLQSFKRHGCSLDTGMHYVGSISEGQIMNQYFKYLGIMDDLQLYKLDENGFDQFHFMDGSTYSHAMGYDRFVDNLASKFPGERANIQKIADRLRTIGELLSPEYLREGRISNGGIEYLSMSAFEEIEKCTNNETLKRVLAGNCGLFAGDRQTSSLYEYGMITHSNISGAYAFVDGSQQMADLLVDQIEANGGEVRLKSKVSKIVLDGATVDYIELESGEQLRAKWIVSSLHPSVTFSLLENNTIYKKAFFTRINSLANTYSIFTTYLLLKPDKVKYVNQNHYLFNNPDVWSIDGDYKGLNIPSTLLCMQPSSKNEYANVVTLLTPMRYSVCEKWANTTIEHRGEDYREFKARYSEGVIDFVGEYFPELVQNIDRVVTASPLTYRDYTATPGGSAYGIVKDCRNPIVTMVPARTRISNLLLTGQNLNIHGCLGTISSATVTCSEIVGMEYLTKKIGNA